ncbi:hypothetical protein B0A48_03052 [Cryoendolithus antarcticus]|uniref:Protein SQS1 n=1 Tax=Cryoendolithus antarcticus TaxID=1507870 RepID=A0A1V8TM11_9PEZI|nr:hypothetical protein B0A48_03052 [Cryoendolithus antarcticus]
MPKKSPKGRAGKKQKAQKSPGGKPPFGKQGKRDVYFDDDDDEPSGPSFRGFTQRSGDSTPGRAAVRLRHQAISFVSASPKPVADDAPIEDAPAVVAALDDESINDTDDDEDEDVDDDAIQTNIVEDVEMEISNGTQAMHIHETAREQTSVMFVLDGAADIEPTQARKASTPLRAEAPSFVIDTVGDISMNGRSKGKGKAPIRPRSPFLSDSSGDEIVFRGRNQPIVVDDPVTEQAKPQSRTEEAHVTDELLKALGVSLEPSETVSSGGPDWTNENTPATRASGWAKAPGWAAQEADPSQGFKPVENGWWRKQNQRVPDVDLAASLNNGNTNGHSGSPPPETVAALRAELKEAIKTKRSSQRTVGALQSAETTSRRGKRGRKRQNRELREINAEARMLNSDDSDEDMAACKDYLENLRKQGEDVDDLLALKSVDAGPSLVVDGRVIADDELLDQSTRDIDFSQLQSMGSGSDDSDNSDDDIIGQDLSELDDDGLNASDYDSSDLENDLEYDEQEQWEDEEDLRQRRRDQMDDETVARLLQKQEELGIEGDEIVIDDGTFMDVEAEGFGDLREARAGLQHIALPTPTRSTPRRKNKGLTFPDASALADAVEQYGDNGFDIMDLDRPSLRPTKKGRKGRLPPELEALSDDDLREVLHDTWDRDRTKKSAKKREREEQRMAGLLGMNGNPDLTAKYSQGMTLSQLHEELRQFLQDDELDAKKFPPMDKVDRAALHAIAGRLNITSKSQGSGKKRFPMLYKTTKTLEYSEMHFNRIIAASQRGFLKNSSYKGKANKFSPAGRGGRGGGASTRGGRGGGVAGHGLRDGEVVGAGAKEISADNFGHRLMEKMGWTKGTALGKDGEGLLVPVAQIMKAGKAGLG